MPARLTSALRLCLAAALAAVALCAAAEKADRSRPMVIEADRPGTLDLQHQVAVFQGNVTITQGTMVIRADRVEVRELPDGYRSATAIGTSAQPANYRQKRDGTNDTVQGEAERIEYDGRADRLHFIGHGSVRRYRDGALADEITGNQITWDANAELFSVEGGAASPANPTGRVRAVLSPREGAASAPAAAPSAPLAPARGLGQGR